MLNAKNKITVLLLCACMLTAFAAPAHAALTEQDMSVQYLVQEGIYQGDQNGDLNLESGLTRAELAVILTRLDYLSSPGGLEDWNTWGQERFSDPENRYNKFTDIPDWALPYVEYCYQRSLMIGVAETRFDPQGKVNPQMAATVMLRYCAIPETDWSYQTSVEKAQGIGIAPVEGMDGEITLRKTMALIIYRSINYVDTGALPDAPAEPSAPPQVAPEPEPSAPAMSIDEMKAEIVRLTNEERVKAGVPELEVLPELMDCAQAKADDMLENSYYDHKSPTYGTPGQMIKSFIPQATSAAENLVPWMQTPQEVIAGILDSPDHLKNMLNSKYTHIGVGIIEGAGGGYWWIQHFCAV